MREIQSFIFFIVKIYDVGELRPNYLDFFFSLSSFEISSLMSAELVLFDLIE